MQIHRVRHRTRLPWQAAGITDPSVHSIVKQACLRLFHLTIYSRIYGRHRIHSLRLATHSRRMLSCRSQTGQFRLDLTCHTHPKDHLSDTVQAQVPSGLCTGQSSFGQTKSSFMSALPRHRIISRTRPTSPKNQLMPFRLDIPCIGRLTRQRSNGVHHHPTRPQYGLLLRVHRHHVS